MMTVRRAPKGPFSAACQVCAVARVYMAEGSLMEQYVEYAAMRAS